MTMNPAPIVVGVDGSGPSLHALDWATREAVARQRPLRIVHAFLWPLYNVPLGPPAGGPPDTGLQYTADQILSSAADRVRRALPALAVSTDLPVCAPAAALIAASHQAGLVVVGHRGLGGFTGLLVGSVGVQTAAHAACPVVVVRDTEPDGPSEGGERSAATGCVVVGVDSLAHSGPAVDFAFTHAALHGLRVVAVNAYQWPPFAVSSAPQIASDAVDDTPTEPTQLLVEALAGCRDRHPDVPVHHKVVHGRTAPVLIAESAGAELTVVGSRGRGGFTGLLLGSTSQSVLQHATGPVAIVPADPPGPGTPADNRGTVGVEHPARQAARRLVPMPPT